MFRTLWKSAVTLIILISFLPIDLNAKTIKVEHLPTIFDDGTYVPEKIEWKTWDETSPIIPKDSIFEIVDFETGLYFKVQRRAGSSHADVQPLTKVDTAIMKEIYDGRWSWKRRAIYIRKGSHLIPASMHGMPHGAGALANNFPGHFCIHLPKSTTHRSSKEDPSHQLMILKASGRLDDYIERATSEELAMVFMLAVNQEDEKIIKKTIRSSEEKSYQQTTFFIQPDKPLRKEEPSSLLIMEYPVEVSERTKKGLSKRKAVLRVERTTLISRWYVDVSSLFTEE